MLLGNRNKIECKSATSHLGQEARVLHSGKAQICQQLIGEAVPEDGKFLHVTTRRLHLLTLPAGILPSWVPLAAAARHMAHHWCCHVYMQEHPQLIFECLCLSLQDDLAQLERPCDLSLENPIDQG